MIYIEEKKIIDFLKQYTRGQTNCCINYKPYEYSTKVETMSFDTAIENFKKDFKDMENFLYAYGIKETDKIFNSVCCIWKKHIVCFNKDV